MRDERTPPAPVSLPPFRQPPPQLVPSLREAPLRQPLLWASLAYAAGIVLGSHLNRPVPLWIAAIFIFILSAAYFIHRRIWLAFTLALGSLILLGALAIQLRSITTPTDPRLLGLADGRQVLITGHVRHEGELLTGSSGEIRQRIDVETEDAAADGQAFPIRVGLRLGIYQRSNKANADEASMPLYRYG